MVDLQDILEDSPSKKKATTTSREIGIWNEAIVKIKFQWSGSWRHKGKHRDLKLRGSKRFWVLHVYGINQLSNLYKIQRMYAPSKHLSIFNLKAF